MVVSQKWLFKRSARHTAQHTHVHTSHYAFERRNDTHGATHPPMHVHAQADVYACACCACARVCVCAGCPLTDLSVRCEDVSAVDAGPQHRRRALDGTLKCVVYVCVCVCVSASDDVLGAP
jgi:hypothetical protein